MTWKTECTYCDETIEVENPDEVITLDGDALHEDCVDAYYDSWDPNLPYYYDHEIHHEPQGYTPYHVQEIWDPWNVVVGGEDSPTEVSSSVVPRHIWDLGHLTSVTFKVDEDWDVRPVAVNGYRVTDERYYEGMEDE